ncbi:MAG: hypothetical protein WCF69_30175 [Mycobacterium sp.]
MVFPEAVVQYRRRPLGDLEHEALAAHGGIGDAGIAQLEGPGPVAAPGGKQHREVGDAGVSGGRGDRVGFVDQLVCGAEIAGEDLMGAEVVEGERKCVQRAGVAGSLGQVVDQLRARLVIPEVHRDVARQPAPPDVVAAEALMTKRGKRSREHRRGCGVAVCEPHRKPVQEQVDGACGLRRCGCRTRCLGSLHQSAAFAEAAGANGCPQGL